MTLLWLAGVALAITATTFGNLGVNIQKYSAMQEEKRTEYRSFWHQPIWVIGFVFVALGSLFDFAALTFAAQSIVATVGSTALVSNIFFAHVYLGEKLSRIDIFGTVLIIAGAALSVGFGDQSDSQYAISDLKTFFYQTAFVIYIICTGGIAVLMYMVILKAEPIRDGINQAKKKYAESDSSKTDLTALNLDEIIDMRKSVDRLYSSYEKFERLHPIAYCYIAGFNGSLVLIFAKCVGEIISLTAQGSNPWVDWAPYVFIAAMAVAIVTETKYLALGLRYFDALFIVPVFQCFFITLGASAGGVFFGEFSSYSAVQAGVFPVGVFITLIGVYILSTRDNATKETEEERSGMRAGYLTQRRESGRSRGDSNSVPPSAISNGVVVNLGKNDEEDDDEETGAAPDKRRASTTSEPQSPNSAGSEKRDSVHDLPAKGFPVSGSDTAIKVTFDPAPAVAPDAPPAAGHRRVHTAKWRDRSSTLVMGAGFMNQLLDRVVDAHGAEEEERLDVKFGAMHARHSVNPNFTKRIGDSGAARTSIRPSLREPSFQVLNGFKKRAENGIDLNAPMSARGGPQAPVTNATTTPVS